MYTYHNFALVQRFLSTTLCRETRHESAAYPSTRDETEAEERGNFHEIKRGTRGKAKFTLKSFTGSQNYVNTTTFFFFPNRRVLPYNCFSNTAKDIELGVREAGGGGAENGREAAFQIFDMYL